MTTGSKIRVRPTNSITQFDDHHWAAQHHARLASLDWVGTPEGRGGLKTSLHNWGAAVRGSLLHVQTLIFGGFFTVRAPQRLTQRHLCPALTRPPSALYAALYGPVFPTSRNRRFIASDRGRRIWLATEEYLSRKWAKTQTACGIPLGLNGPKT